MLTVKEGFALYLSKRVMAESSAEIKERALRLFIEAVGDLPVKSVTYAEAEDYKVWLAKTKTMAAANIYLANLRPFFGWLKARGFIEQDPFASVQRYDVDVRRHEIFEPAEIERIMQVADLRWQAITLLGLCSLRRSETLNLTIDDLDFEKGFLRISTKSDTDKTWRWEIKNHRQAIVPMPESFELPDGAVNLHRILKDLIAELPFGQPYVCIQPDVYKRLLSLNEERKLAWKWRNCPWQNFTRDWLRLLKRAAVRRRRYHDLRGTMPSTMARRGVPLPEIQRLMRHKSIQTTSAYYIQVDEQNLIDKTAEIASTFCQ